MKLIIGLVIAIASSSALADAKIDAKKTEIVPEVVACTSFFNSDVIHDIPTSAMVVIRNPYFNMVCADNTAETTFIALESASVICKAAGYKDGWAVSQMTLPEPGHIYAVTPLAKASVSPAIVVKSTTRATAQPTEGFAFQLKLEDVQAIASIACEKNQ